MLICNSAWEKGNATWECVKPTSENWRLCLNHRVENSLWTRPETRGWNRKWVTVLPCMALYCMGVMCSKPGGGTSQYLQVRFFLVLLGEWLQEPRKDTAKQTSEASWVGSWLSIPASSVCTCASCGPWRNCGGPGSCDRGCGCASPGCGCLDLCSSCGACRLGWAENCCGSSSCVAPALVLSSQGTKTHRKTQQCQWGQNQISSWLSQRIVTT